MGLASNNPELIFKDPEWADQADALVSAIFMRGHLKRVAQVVAAEICDQARLGRSLAEIAVGVNGKSEDFRAAYRIALDAAPLILKNKIKEPPRSAIREIVGADEDAELAGWAKKLLADRAVWERRRKP